MSSFICELCQKKFNTKYELERHQNRKNKCDKKTEFQCEKCLKYFNSKYYLKTHIETCVDYKNNIDYDDNSNYDKNLKTAIKSIIDSDDTIENKILLITNYDININNDKLKILLNSNISNEGKVCYICSNINNNKNNKSVINTNSNNTISNSNNTMNIQINQFGKEDITYLDQEYFKNLLNHERNLENQLITLTKDIHLRLDHPENRNIKVTNLNNRYATIFSNGKWRGITKDTLKEELHRKNIKLIKIHYNQLKDVLNEKHKNNVKILLGRDLDDDPVLKEINDKIILLFYSKDE